MKTLIFLFTIICFWLNAQTDTLIISNIVAKKATIRAIYVDTSQVTTEIKETIDYAKALARIEKLEKDTLQYVQQLAQAQQFETQLYLERKRIQKMLKDSKKLIDRLKALLPGLKP